jgi:hypothetical protein
MEGPGSIPGLVMLFSFHRVQTDPGAYPATYPTGNGAYFPWSKAAGA